MEQSTVKHKNYLADGGLLLIAIMWGGGFVVTKNALEQMTPLMIMAIRFVIAAIILTFIFWKRLKQINKRDFWGGCLIGFFLFLGFATQTIGLVYTTASKNAFITGTNVVIVPFLVMAVTKRFPGWHAILAALIAVVGLAFLTIEDGSLATVNIGDWLTLLCAFCYACQVVTIGLLAPKGDAILLSVMQVSFCALLFVVAALLFEPIPARLSVESWGAIAYLVIFNTVLSFLMQNVAQKYTPSSRAALILCLEGVFGAVFAFLILGELFTGQMLWGCLMIFGAIIIAELKPDLFRLQRLNPNKKEV